MTQRQNIRRPQPGEIPHAAGEYLYKYGSASEAELFLAVNFGRSQHERSVALHVPDWSQREEGFRVKSVAGGEL